MFPNDFWTRSLISAQSDTGLSVGSSYKCHTSRGMAGMGGGAAISWGSPELTSVFTRLQGEASWRGNAEFRWSWKHPSSPSGDIKCSQGLSNRSKDWCTPAWVPSVNCCKHRWRCTWHGAREQHPVQALQPSLTSWPPLLPFSSRKITSKWTCCHFLHPLSFCCCWSQVAYALLAAITQIYMSKDDWRYICLFLIYEISMRQKGDWVKRQKTLAAQGRHVKLMSCFRTVPVSCHSNTHFFSPWKSTCLGNFILWGRTNLRERLAGISLHQTNGQTLDVGVLRAELPFPLLQYRPGLKNTRQKQSVVPYIIY